MRDRPIEPWRRVPPALGAIYRLRYDEAEIHEQCPPLTDGEGGPRDRFGVFYWLDERRVQYVIARRVRRMWRLNVWRRGSLRACRPS